MPTMSHHVHTLLFHLGDLRFVGNWKLKVELNYLLTSSTWRRSEKCARLLCVTFWHHVWHSDIICDIMWHHVWHYVTLSDIICDIIFETMWLCVCLCSTWRRCALWGKLSSSLDFDLGTASASLALILLSGSLQVLNMTFQTLAETFCDHYQKK